MDSRERETETEMKGGRRKAKKGEKERESTYICCVFARLVQSKPLYPAPWVHRTHMEVGEVYQHDMRAVYAHTQTEKGEEEWG